jgi:hypothetical protein
MTRILAFASIILCAGALAYGLWLGDFLLYAVLVLLFGIGWIALYLLGLTRFDGLMFALFVLASLSCVWAGVSQWIALAGVTFSLLAWDLIVFGERLRMTDSPSDARGMELAHLVRVFLVLGAAAAGYIAAGVFEISLTFGAAALLALLGIWGISALVYRLRNQE